MIWQLTLLVGSIFITGALYGAFINRLVVGYLNRRGSRENTGRVAWNWVGERTSLRFPTPTECSQVPDNARDGALRTLCAELYGNPGAAVSTRSSR